MPRVTDYFYLVQGHISRGGALLFVCGSGEADEKDVPAGQLFIHDATGSWSQRVFQWKGVAVATAAPPVREIVLVGREGEVLVGTPAGYSQEQIVCGGTGPEQYGPIRNAREVAARVYVVGMGRQVYRREAPNTWTRLDAGLPTGEPTFAVSGFNAIDGFDDARLWAVGWGGEIWFYDGMRWTQVASPTNVALFDATVGSPDELYACGQLGTILRIRGDTVNVLGHDGPEFDFRSLAWFANHLFLADGTALHRLDGTALTQIPMLDGEPVPVHHLHVRGDTMLATGRDVAMTSKDGVSWTAVPV